MSFSIRKSLLLAFVGVGLSSAMVLAVLAFVQAKQALQAEIEQTLLVQARGVSGEMDKMMFERLQNAATWSKLDIMQDLQVQDVDKRLSQFLASLQEGYRDVYLSLSGVDESGRIVASSDPARVGSQIRNLEDPSVVHLDRSAVTLGFDGQGSALGLRMSVPVDAVFRAGRLGQLTLLLDWRRMEEVLDAIAGGDGRLVAVLDAQGRLIGGSESLRGEPTSMSTVLAAWRRPKDGVYQMRGSSGPIVGEMMVGQSRSKGYASFAGLGWTTLVIQPVDQALLPVHRMATTFIGLMGLIFLATVAIATWISRKIAEPIVALTRFTRGYMQKQAAGPPPMSGPGEVGELSEAFVSMVRDIARSQESLVRASKLAVLGEMSAVIAHEVRTPLGILRSSAQILQREAHISEQGRELLGFIGSETERLNALVSAMLDTARPREAHFAPVDLHALIHRCVGMLAGQAQSRQVLVTEDSMADDPVIDCDSEQITQVVLNILMNGLQILEHGGRIEVSTRDLAEHLEILVADDGPGIDPAKRSKVFEAFFFQREGGIGLGLAIVQQIVIAHGGHIEAGESELGGALFRVRLPRRQASYP